MALHECALFHLTGARSYSDFFKKLKVDGVYDSDLFADDLISADVNAIVKATKIEITRSFISKKITVV